MEHVDCSSHPQHRGHRRAAGVLFAWSIYTVVAEGLFTLFFLSTAILAVEPAANQESIWNHDNLFAWEVANYDTKKRSPDERARMLERLGFKHYVYLGSADPIEPAADVNVTQQNVDEEIEAMLRHHIDILAWYFWVNSNEPADVPLVTSTLQSFSRHHINPDIWVTNSYAYLPKSPREWEARVRGRLPRAVVWPRTANEYQSLPRTTQQIVAQVAEEIEADNEPKTPQEQRQRVDLEASRIRAFVRLAAPYGCRVNIYNHRGWFGMIENELAILARLNEMGIKNVGMVYNFGHSRDLKHDDSAHFAMLWPQIKDYVTAVNITGLSGVEEVVFPSQGDRELGMMRTIEQSGWRGPVGVLVLWKTADTEIVLRRALKGLDWTAAELHRSGSGGPRPLLGSD